MASHNLMAMEQFRQTFFDPWISNFFTNETETLAKDLQNSFSGITSSNGDVFSNELIEPLFSPPEITPVQTPTISGASENEVPVLKQRRSIPPSRKVAKRKSRASKRETTTFITADPANFRQIVQQVTSARFSGLEGQFPVFKPEAQRAVNELVKLGGNYGFPMLDASSFFVDGSASSFMDRTFPPSTVVSDNRAASVGIGFDSFCSFPTLESWKV